jgi:Uncharacterized conserved protein (DUF2285)
MHDGYARDARNASENAIDRREFNRVPCDLRFRSMTVDEFQDRAPDSLALTEYDRRHAATYVRILDAADEDADWRDAVQIIFGIDPAKEPDRARIIYASHLARARWMTQSGYRHLLKA